MDGNDESRTYKVVVNHEEQYSIWPADQDEPDGWSDEGTSGTRQACLDHIQEVWTDMRPLSLRQAMQAAEEQTVDEPPVEPAAPEDPRDDLVGFLSSDGPVELGLRPEASLEALRQCLDRGHIHVRFTATRGGTEVGFPIDREASDLDAADLVAGTGTIGLAGDLRLNSVAVRCRAAIDLETLTGTGRLERLEH